MCKELRNDMLKKRKHMLQSDIEEKSNIISKKLFDFNEYKNAKTLFLYINFGSEVITKNIIEKAWCDGKKVAVPISLGNRDMYFVEIKDFSNMIRKKIGTLEPNLDRSFEIVPDENTLFIVPGSVFDEKCNRWGYGGGYYDTYLEKYNVKNTIGLCYDFQVVKKLNIEPHDKKMKYVLTEKRMTGGEKMSNIIEMGIKAKDASVELARLSTGEKNRALNAAADALIEDMAKIIEINKEDVKKAIENGIKGAFIDRLTLTEDRIKGMADGLRDVAALPDPVGEVISMKTLDNGLIIGQKRVPMGVIGIIFEARPNVTADAFGLCLKAGSATILRGGKEAIGSNTAIVKSIQKALKSQGISEYAVQIVEDTSRETAKEMMRLNGYIDVLIPRGGAGLINSVIQNSTVPVIQTGVGNCHIFVDETAKQEDAVKIVLNAKTQRPGVCNAAEKLLVHENIAKEFMPKVCEALKQKNVELRGDIKTREIAEGINEATDEDWATEYEDLIMSLKVVKNVDEAIEHIRKYTTHHSEAIITENYSNAQKFLNEVDAAAVYVNASTRFTDGGQFGFGAEIGISTQKLHARGPMGLKELTTTKYIIYGNGQIRE